MSPIHIQYLKNMGVGATLVVSLVAAGKLWGLVACHHYSPRFVHYEMRAVCELLAETIATRIAALESFVQAEAELTVRRLEQRMIEAISRAGDWRQALFDSSQSLLQPLKASGAALLFENQILTAGEVPGTVQLRQLGSWLDDAPRASVHATRSLGLDEPEFAPLTPVASGLLATPISASPGEYLIWFRPERVRTVTWGGNPHKPMEIGDDPSDLSPRRSFAQWHEVVKGTAETWTPADMATARMIGHTVADVVLQFRSVRMLIAQDQLKQVSGQVGKSDQPVIIADPRGRILLTNEAFEQLLQSAPPHVERIEDLASLFAEPSEVRDTLKELVDHHRVWRGEVRLKTSARETRTLVLRADPVFSAPERVLGFVLLFTDVTERKAVEIARGRFQQAIIEQQRAMALQLEPSDNPVYRKLLASIMGNAQLAALEITDGVELAQVPDLLEGVQTSAIRTAELLEHLMLHASRAAKYEP